MLLFSPDPSTEDIRDFMGDAARREWDSGKGTVEERERYWEGYKELWRSIPDPTEEQLQPYMLHEDLQICREDSRRRDDILNFYRRLWKRQRTPEHVLELQSEPQLPKAKSPTVSEAETDNSSKQETPSSSAGDKPKGVDLFDLVARAAKTEENDTKDFIESAKRLTESLKKHDEELARRGRDMFKKLARPPETDWSPLQAAYERFPPVDLQRAETSPASKVATGFWAEVEKHRGWYFLAFLLSGLPVFIATIWGPIMGSKTIPQWLAENGWPRLTTLVIGWVVVACVIAVVIVARSYYGSRNRKPGLKLSSDTPKTIREHSGLEAWQLSPTVTAYMPGVVQVNCLVLDADTHKPVPQASITAYGNDIYTARANREGFAVLKVRAGSYTLVTTGTRYEERREPVRFDEGSNLKISLVRIW